MSVGHGFFSIDQVRTAFGAPNIGENAYGRLLVQYGPAVAAAINGQLPALEKAKIYNAVMNDLTTPTRVAFLASGYIIDGTPAFLSPKYDESDSQSRLILFETYFT